MKYVLVSGGVISGIGKGVLASSTGLLLKTIGFKVTSIKIDPYLNIDAGTMSPMEHGEVFVLDDGGEADLDLGNYERYLNVTLTRENNLTTGKIYQHVIERERAGKYLGKTVQLVPHITDAIMDWIQRVALIPVDATNEAADVCIIELGGTVGDLESAPFIEAMRQLRRRVGKDNFLQIHVCLVPNINGELKTKPTQSAIKEVRMLGLAPDLIACRCSRIMEEHTVAKIAQFCDVERDQIPLSLESQGILEHLKTLLRLDTSNIKPQLVDQGSKTWNEWKKRTLEQDHLHDTVTIALVGKYTDHPDAYHSVVKSLEHAAMACSRKLKLVPVNAEYLEEPARHACPAEYHQAWHLLHTAGGVIVPGGFGERGIAGMLAAIRKCRENGIPFLGICLGLQLAVIEYARNMCNITDADSEEFSSKPPNPVVIFMPEVDRTTMGATMRLGLRPTYFQHGSEFSKLRKLYEQSRKTISSGPLPNGTLLNGSHDAENCQQDSLSAKDGPAPLAINERHRHRYEVNPEYVERLTQGGLRFVGKGDGGKRMEILELPNHKWFVAVQYHPEYLSRVLQPSEPYLGFVAASANVLEDIMCSKGRRGSSFNPLDGDLALNGRRASPLCFADMESGHGVEDVGLGREQWHQLAEKHWLGSQKSRKIRAEVIKKEIWDVLEKENFAYSNLLTLEGLGLLESYLWPGFNENVTNHHVLLMAILLTVKAREKLTSWDLFASDPVRFSAFFRRVLALSLDSSLNASIRQHLLITIIHAFQSLDNALVRKECAPLVSISLWHNMATENAREEKLDANPQLRKAWRASSKRYEAADDQGKAKLRFERSWLYSLLVDFLGRLYEGSTGDVEYCERFLEFVADLESQMPTRRYVNTLLRDLNFLSLVKLSPMLNRRDNGLLRDLYILLRHYVLFPINDHTGIRYSREESHNMHDKDLARLQGLALKSFSEKLTILALSNYASIDLRAELEGHLRTLDDAELEKLTSMLGFRTCYPKISGLNTIRDLSQEVLLSAFERTKTFQEVVADMSVLPTETALYEESLLRNEVYDGSRPLAIPKLNLQYLSSGDFLWRSFILHRCEQFFEIRKYLEDVIKRVRPTRSGGCPEIGFEGFSKVALPVTKPAILETAPPKVGSYEPAFVRAEITLNVTRLADNVRKDWDALRPEDSVFLVCASPGKADGMTNGHGAIEGPDASGLRAVRVAEVVMVLDENGRPVREPRPDQVNGHGPRPRIRRLLVNLDPVAFEDDISRKGKGLPDVYEQINLVVRRNKRENNFKKILETIRSLTVSEVSIPAWLQDVFLGFGDPTAATHQNLPNNIKALDIRDTIIDWQHLLKSFPGVQIESANEVNEGFDPPYVVEDKSSHASVPPRSSKKRRRDEAEQDTEAIQASKRVRISTYQTPSQGPYPTDAPKVNEVPFTPTQVQAVISGTQPGLTIIVGPPGTGKTDVATQIISNIYHDFPTQRTLLIAHSNQALNQLFQKITKLDIDGRHLLRLGQGEADLDTSESFSKYGRVESFLDNRAMYLAEVDRLAANFGAPGAHGGSCETAGYFNLVYVKPAWKKFWDTVHSTSSSPADIIASFPFHHYFQTAPQPLLPEQASKDELVNIAHGCERHISKIFSELEDIRPFEILRSNKDKTNYLMIKEARIIAMTSTHAAMRREEIAQLGFHYDNVVMEEAAQITEIENFIPLALQHPKDGQNPLQRIVLCGDHLQNSPIVQNLAFRHFANLEQGLFLRLVRLGVPTINLDAQGRARASLAALYRWRYPNLDNLPNVQTQPEFLRANAGFRYDYQFIDIPDYKGRGEMQPSPHFLQNLGEAEYAVALYQYMRLLGYPASKISILTTYAGQRALIRDVLTHRCAGNRLFGMPRIVSTVDKYQGEQNDYVILSLVRTSRPGYLRDLRRLTVALSRARLGLYILGRRTTFESAAEIARAFELPLQRPDKLMITTGEMFPAERLLDDDVAATEMVGVEHLGQYVYEMTQAKVKMLKEGAGVLPPQEPEQLLDVDRDDDLGRGGEAEDEGNDEGDVEVEVKGEEVL